MYSKKISVLVAICLFISCSIAFAQSESFLKKGSYLKRVEIEKPETSLLAEVFLRNGISVTSNTPLFHFKTADADGKFTVFIYYRPNSYTDDFVGKFVYEKTNAENEASQFVNAFVAWMIRNAWSR